MQVLIGQKSSCVGSLPIVGDFRSDILPRNSPFCRSVYGSNVVGNWKEAAATADNNGFIRVRVATTVTRFHSNRIIGTGSKR
jgi:hypothetical protein